MNATLYVIPARTRPMAVAPMLELQGIAYKRVDLMPVISRGVLKAMRFPRHTIPSLRIDGRKITGSREISQALDEIQPEPPLFPADPAQRAAVEEAERWGEEVLADAVRRILWNAIRRDKAPLRQLRGGRPAGRPDRAGRGDRGADHRRRGADQRRHRRAPSATTSPRSRAGSTRSTSWIAEGLSAATQPNAADLQIAAALRLAMTLQDLRAAHRRPPRRRAGDAPDPGLPGRRPAGPAGRVARAAAGAGAAA